MPGAAATMAGAALLFIAAVAGMAAVSHCSRRVRAWPAILLATSALVMSDRSMVLIGTDAPLVGIRWLLAIVMFGSAAGTVVVMSWLITTACPLCRGIPAKLKFPQEGST